jgi:hypothetical protein
MALPGSKGGPAARGQEVELAEKYATIFRLRLRHGMPWRKIGIATGYAPGHCRNVFYEQRRTEAGRLTIEAHRHRILGELIEIAEVARPWALGYIDEIPDDQAPPSKEHADLLFKSLDYQRKLLGTDAPRETSTTSWATQQIGSTPEGERIARRTQRLMELLKDHPLSDQEMLDIDSTEVSVPTGDSSVPLTNGHRSVDGNGVGS